MRIIARGLFTTSALAATLAVAPTPAIAQAQTFDFNIPAQPLDSSLRAFAKASRQQILFDRELVRGKTSPALKGSYSADAAVAQLLGGSGLTATRTSAGSWVVARSAVGNGSAATEAAAAFSNSQNSSESNRDDAGKQAGAVAEILVTGRRTLNTAVTRSKDDAQPYIVLTQKDVARSGATTVEEFLHKSNPTDASPVSSVQVPGSLAGNATSIDLRGLGANQTLVLVDGRRLVGDLSFGAPGQPDLNSIPLAAIERVEILPTTAAGIYGGGATGGAINIIMRRDYSGFEGKLALGMTSDGLDFTRQLNVTLGVNANKGRTNILLSGSYLRADGLKSGDRDLALRGRARILASNSTGILNAPLPPLGSTTNITSTDGSELSFKPIYGGASLGSTRTFVPVGYGGIGTDNGAALAANAGKYNLDLPDTAQSAGLRQSLLDAPIIATVAATVRHKLSDALEIFTEFSYADNKSASVSNTLSTDFTLAADAPGNPFEQSITINTPALGTDYVTRTHRINARAAAGALFRLPFHWRGEADLTWNHTYFTSRYQGSLSYSAALDRVTTGAVDVFNSSNPPDFSSFLLAPSIIFPVRTNLYDAALRASGPMFSLPGGTSTLSIALEHRSEQFGRYHDMTTYSPTDFAEDFIGPRSQLVDSAYAEVALPFLSEENDVPGVSAFSLQIATRFDKYTIRGSSFDSVFDGIPSGPTVRTKTGLESANPTIALKYSPLRGVVFRGSFGTGFLPPSLSQITPGYSTQFPGFYSQLFNLTDPLRGGEYLGDFTRITGGNPDLKPEKSRSWSAGVILTPQAIRGLRLSVDWTRISKTDNIAQLNILDDSGNLARLIEVAPDRIKRGPVTPGDPYSVGPIIAVDDTNLNFARGLVEAVDFAFDYGLSVLSIGQVSLHGDASYLYKVQDTILPDIPSIEHAGARGQPVWRANGRLSWEHERWSASWETHFLGGYYLNTDHLFVPNQGSARVASQLYHDIHVSRRLGPDIRATELSLNIDNLFDSKPPVDVSNVNAFYSTLGSPLGRFIKVSIQQAF